ncbi:MAG: DUF2513 domain-containing protein [Anaerorhabdus sp.]|uniref:DUF2513 domain-containing protein n=1 Tax=Anaerorhabdus sp. TaxID=1872524 RepID=UPI002FC795FD
MEINLDCIRDVLLYISKNQRMDNDFKIEPISSAVIISQLKTDYNEDEIAYSIRQLCMQDYLIYNTVHPVLNIYLIRDISPKGHEFIQNTQEPTVWEKTKSKLSGFKNISISIVNSVAVKILTDFIAQQM